MRVSSQPSDEIITFALGSCLGIAIWDPVAHVGGMLHAVLPLSTIDPPKAEENPAMFVDTGVPQLFTECYRLGAEKQRLVVKVAGGACTRGPEEEDYFQIGKRNITMFRKLLWKNSVLVTASDVGETRSRTMSLNIGSGLVLIRTAGVSTEL
jgi:chemotaxis protein CheD